MNTPMPAPQSPNSRPGRLRALAIGEEVVETEMLETPAEAAKRRQAILNSWCTATARVAGMSFITESYSVINGDNVRVFIVCRREI